MLEIFVNEIRLVSSLLSDFLSFDGISLPRVPLRFEKRRVPISSSDVHRSLADTVLQNELQPVAGPSRESPEKGSQANNRNDANLVDSEEGVAEVSATRKEVDDVVCASPGGSDAINANGNVAISPRTAATEKRLPETTKWLQKRRLCKNAVKLRPPLRPPPVTNTADGTTSAPPSNGDVGGRQDLTTQEVIRETLRRNILNLNKYTGIKVSFFVLFRPCTLEE